MAKPTLSEIIFRLQEISRQASEFDAELSAKINQEILDLQKMDTTSKADQVIDRVKKIVEILTPFSKIIYEHFKDT